MTGPLLAIFPHPDDETFTAGGVMAAAAERGVPVTVISATRGEAGDSALPGLDPDQLGAVREEELRDALRHLGVTDVWFLGYRDSGMEGSPDANHPNAFVRAAVSEVAATLVSSIRDIRPGAIVTFGPDGIYGHPDHIHLHHAVLRAVIDAADPAFADPASRTPWRTPALYFGTAPREDLLATLDRPDSPFASLSAEALARLGTPRAEITHVIDVAPWTAQKRAALLAHRTQTAEGGPLSAISSGQLENRLQREHFVRAPLPWGAPSEEPDLLDQFARASSPE